MGALTDVQTVKDFLGKSNDAHDGLIRTIIEGVSARMEGYTGRKFSMDEYTSEPVESPGFSAIVLDHGPILSVVSVLEEATTLLAADYRVEAPNTLVRLSSALTSIWVKGTVFVTYEAGYDDIPADLDYACAMQCAREFGMSTPGGATLGRSSISPTQASGESTKYEMKPWLPQVQQTLDQYRSII